DEVDADGVFERCPVRVVVADVYLVDGEPSVGAFGAARCRCSAEDVGAHSVSCRGLLAGEMPIEEVPDFLPSVHDGAGPVGRGAVVVEESVPGIGVSVELVLFAVAA